MLKTLFLKTAISIDDTKIPIRQKHFNSLLFTILFYCLSFVPLYELRSESKFNSVVSFSSAGTLMTIGTQPFIFGSMVSKYMDKENPYETGMAIGFLASLIQATTIGLKIDSILLTCMTIAMYQAQIYIHKKGSVDLSSALIFIRASSGLAISIYQAPSYCITTCITICICLFIDSFVVHIPIKSSVSRYGSSIPLKMMYNGMTPLITWETSLEGYYSLLVSLGYEHIAFYLIPGYHIVSFILYSFGLITISLSWQYITKSNGYTMIANWKKEKIHLKGYRSDQAAGKFVNDTINQLVKWNTIFLYGLWLCGMLFPHAIAPTTCLILISVVKEHWIEDLW